MKVRKEATKANGVFVLEWDCLHPYGTTTALVFGNYNNQCIQVIRTGT